MRGYLTNLLLLKMKILNVKVSMLIGLCYPYIINSYLNHIIICKLLDPTLNYFFDINYQMIENI